MNRFSLIVVAMLLGCVACTHTKRREYKGVSNLSDYSLSGRVKACTSFYYKHQDAYNHFSGDSVREDDLILVISECLFFDEGEKLTFETSYNIDGYSIETSYAYDNRGRLTEKYSVEGGDSCQRREIHCYDKKGRRMETYVRDQEDKQVSRIEYAYDEEQRLVEEVAYSEMDVVMSRIAYTFGEKGNLTKTLTCTDEDNPTIEVVYNYDANQRLTNLNEKMTNGCRKTVYDYDDQGLLLEERMYSDERGGEFVLERVKKFSYNDLQQKLEESLYDLSEDGTLILFEQTNYRYDENDYLIEKSTGNEIVGQKTMRTILYEYDEKGNWIKSIEKYTFGGEQTSSRLLSFITRNIEYYE